MSDVRVVLGPPGTGKTTRLMAILDEELASGVPPEEIGFVSFTRAAVTEARDRASRKFGIDPKRFHGFRTVHSAAFRLIGYRHQLLDRQDWRAFEERYGYRMSQADDRSSAEENPADPPVNTEDDKLRAAVEWSRVRLVSVDEGLRTFEESVDARRVRQFEDRYRDFKRETQKIDFTDMLEIALHQRLSISARVLFVDESQDLSPLQIALVELWMRRAERVYVAGDDDQAIYRFGGAEPDWLMGLAERSDLEALTRSWRVPRAPHAVAQQIIGRNRRRVPKTYAPTERVGSVHYLTREAAIESIDTSERTFILARNISFLKGLSRELFHSRIPYVCERGSPGPLGRPALVEAANVAAAIRAGQGVAFGDLHALSKFVPASLLGKRGTKSEIERRAKRDPDAPCDWTLDELRHEIDGRGPVGILLAKKVDSSTREYLADLLGDGDALPTPAVTLTTIHGSKGREADHVIVVSDHSGKVHRTMAHDPEAENRVAYVAVTRTRDRLTIMRPQTHRHYPYPIAVGG